MISASTRLIAVAALLLGAQAFVATSVDGAHGTVCTLRTTTCPALAQLASPVSGCTTPFTDDAACGAVGFNDGRCRSIASEVLCTYPCLGNEDCMAGTTCPTGSDRYCSF